MTAFSCPPSKGGGSERGKEGKEGKEEGLADCECSVTQFKYLLALLTDRVVYK